MADAGAIRAGRAYVELGTEQGPLAAGLKLAEGKLRAFAGVVRAIGLGAAGLGAAVVTPLVLAAKGAAERGNDLFLTAQRLGTTVEALSKLQYAFGRVGVSEQSAEGALHRFTDSLTEAVEKGGRAAEAFAYLRINALELYKLPLDERLARVADAYQRVRGEPRRNQVVQGLFGDRSLKPLLAQGGGGVRKHFADAEARGLVTTAQSARAAREYTLALKDLSGAVIAPMKILGATLIPTLTKAVRLVTPYVVQVVKFVKAHKEAAVVALGLGASLVALGSVLKVTVVLVGAAATVLSVLGQALALKATITAYLLVLKSLGLILIGAGTPASVLAVSIFAIYRALNVFVYKAVSSSEVMTRLVAGFKELGATAVETWGGIKDAIAAGDLKLAMQVAWAGIKLTWYKGIDAIREAWAGFQVYWGNSLDEMAGGFRATWNDIIFALRRKPFESREAAAKRLGWSPESEDAKIVENIEASKKLREREAQAESDARKAANAKEMAELKEQLDLARSAAFNKANQRRTDLPNLPGSGELARKVEVSTTFASAAAGLAGARGTSQSLLTVSQQQLQEIRGMREDVKKIGKAT